MQLNEEHLRQAIKAYEHDVTVIDVKIKDYDGNTVIADVLGETEDKVKEWANDVEYDVGDLSLAYNQQLNTTIFAFDLSRVYQWFGQKAFAVISAYLSDKSNEENVANQNQLKADVRAKGYGYKEMKGAWRPDPNSPVSFEYSLFIPQMTPADAVELGKKYGQQAVLYGDGQNIILDFMGDPNDNLVFNKMETDYQDAWISWSEFKRKKYRFASVQWDMFLPPVPKSWIMATALQAFLDPKRCYDYREKK